MTRPWLEMSPLDRRHVGLVLGVDPGLSPRKGSALAFLRADTGAVVHAALVRQHKHEHWIAQTLALWDHVWRALTGERYQPPGREGRGHLRAVSVELPQVYDRRNTGERKIDPNDLVELGALAGAWYAVVLEVCPAADVQLVRPAAWKGQVPKDVIERRLRADLSQDEIAIVERAAPPSLLDNVWDAVGIARWAWRKTSKLNLKTPAGWHTTPDGPYDP